MGATFNRGNIIRIGINIFGIGIVILDRHLNKDIAAACCDINRLFMKDFAVFVQVFDK